MEKFIAEIADMNLEQLIERKAELVKEIRSAKTEDDIADMDERLDAIDARISDIKEHETRKAAAQKLKDDEAPVKTVESRKENNMPNLTEVRSSLAYGKAFLNAIKTGDDTEARALLTEQVSGGSIPVPTFLENEIKTAWEENKIMGLVKKSYLKGNVKVGFEVSATGASVHVEGSEAPEEETVVIGTVELKAQSIKKWITVSDEALEGTTVDTIGYLYKEIAHKIVEKAEEIIIAEITTAQVATDKTHPGVSELSMNIEVDTVVIAESLLSAQARNLNVVMNRQTYPAFVKLALEAGYAIDVFDGLKEKIVYSDKLPAFSAASTGAVYMIIGDFSYGFQANFPNGNNLTIKVDDLSLAEKDLVKLVGRQYVGLGIVAPKCFTNVKKVAKA